MMDYAERLHFVAGEVDKAGLAALLVFAWGAAHGQTTLSHGHMRYLTGWDSQRFCSLLVLVPGRRPIMLVPNIGAFVTAREQLDFCEVRFCASNSLGMAAAACLAEHGIDAEAGLAMLGRDEMPVPVWEQLGRNAAQVTDFAGLINSRRAVKDDAAIARHRRAAAACDAVFAHLPEQLHSGRNLFSIRARLQAVAADHGAEYCDLWLTAAPDAQREYMFKVDMQRIPQRGDQILCGVSLTIDGHWGHGVRAGHMGRPEARHRFYYDVVREIYDTALSQLRPGVDLAAVGEAMDRILAKRIPQHADVQQFSRFRYAHGLGLSYEDPIVTDSFPQPYFAGQRARSCIAEPGMLLEIHPNIFHASDGGCALGNMIVMTEEGFEELTRHDLALASY